MRNIQLAFPLVTIALAGCGYSGEAGIAHGQQQYLAAKASCVAEYPNSLVPQSDCRARAANAYIRPYYRYDDLITWAQQRRRALAEQVDEHQMSRAAYDRAIAQSEKQVAREEDRRNGMSHTTSSYQATPFSPVLATIGRLLQ